MASQAIGIDIGTHAVKVAVLQRKGATTRALRLFQATLAGDEDMVRVQGALARAGIKGGRRPLPTGKPGAGAGGRGRGRAAKAARPPRKAADASDKATRDDAV